MTYLILLLSLSALILGADILVRGAVNLAAALGAPTLIIGLTIVAWGTSAPELVVSLTSGLQREYGIALGNILGSNLANILLIGGMAATLMGLATTSAALRSNIILLLIVSLIMVFMVLSGFLNPFVGLGLLAIKVFLLIRPFKRSKCAGELEAEVEVKPEAMDPIHAGLLALGGAILVGGGGFFLVESAAELAEIWHVPPAIIGLTVVAIGTSLPELAATIAAVRQRQGDLILGNIIGSNLTNILIVFGFTALLAPGYIPHAGAYMPILTLMMLATLALAGFILARRPLGRGIGLVFLAIYMTFMFVTYFLDGSHP